MTAAHLWLCCGHVTKPNQAPVGGVGWGGVALVIILLYTVHLKPQLFNNQMLTRAFVQTRYENKAQTRTCADTDVKRVEGMKHLLEGKEKCDYGTERWYDYKLELRTLQTFIFFFCQIKSIVALRHLKGV